MTPVKQLKSGARRERNAHGSGQRLRQELMDAADRLLAAGATPESLSLRAVAREAGVAAPSVYLQFESKDALVDAVVAKRFRQLAELVTTTIAAMTDPYERLLHGCEAYIAFAQQHPSAYRMIFEINIPVLGPETLTGRDVFQLLVDATYDCLPPANASPERAFAIATDIWVAMHGMVSLRRHLPAFPWPDTTEQLGRHHRRVASPLRICTLRSRACTLDTQCDGAVGRIFKLRFTNAHDAGRIANRAGSTVVAGFSMWPRQLGGSGTLLWSSQSG